MTISPTARSWLAVLEIGFLVFRLPAWHRNVRKRIVRTPKLHFFDTGLVCSLLGIRSPEELRHHPLRGAVFETWVVSEIWKARSHRGVRPDLFHYRDRKGLEIDALLDDGAAVTLVEAKSAETIAPDFFSALRRVEAQVTAAVRLGGPKKRLVYGGDTRTRREGVEVIPWRKVADATW